MSLCKIFKAGRESTEFLYQWTRNMKNKSNRIENEQGYSERADKSLAEFTNITDRVEGSSLEKIALYTGYYSKPIKLLIYTLYTR